MGRSRLFCFAGLFGFVLAPSAWADAALSAAILPDARSAVVGATVTIFASVIAAGETATGCSIVPTIPVPADFLYQTTDPATNALTGSPNTPVSIPEGTARSFLIAFTPTAEFDQTQVTFAFDCDNSAPAPVNPVNTLLLSASVAPTPDVIAIAVAPGGAGTLALTANDATGAFAVAALNVGASGPINVDVARQGLANRVDVFGCQTDASGACIHPTAPALLPLPLSLDVNVPATFSIFAKTGSYVRFAPGENRLRVVFRDALDVTRGATSVAVRAVPTNALDVALITLAETEGLTGDPTRGRELPKITEALAQLGKLLFFSKSLSGDQQTACASCHHPALGGGDGLSLPVGTDAVNPNVVGPGRQHTSGLPVVGRHAPTVFNTGLYDKGLFWDSRIESLGKLPGRNGDGSGIRTPDTALGLADPDAGRYLLSAQAQFPVTVAAEMRAAFRPGDDNDTLRAHLAARIGNFGSGSGVLSPNAWLPHFQAAFQSNADAATLITFRNIAEAIAAYQRSMVFIENRWKKYLEGDLAALTPDQKEGGAEFFRTAAAGGAACASCHSGDFFTNELHHNIAVPQIGPGKGNGADDDFGRENQTGLQADRYRFRTPTLLNVEVTGPYFHTGSHYTLFEVVRHYSIPFESNDEYFNLRKWCSTSQFLTLSNCQNRFPNARANTAAAFTRVLTERTSDPDLAMPDIIAGAGALRSNRIAAFMEALTDPCTKDRQCLAPWIPTPSEAPDANQLNAVRNGGAPL